jgi:hypothetical protein
LVSLFIWNIPFMPRGLQKGHKVPIRSLDICVPGFNIHEPQIRVYLDYDEQPMVDLCSSPRLTFHSRSHCFPCWSAVQIKWPRLSTSCPLMPVYIDYDEQ